MVFCNSFRFSLYSTLLNTVHFILLMMKLSYIVQMIINIHWGKVCGAVERTEIHFPIKESVYQYCMLLRGCLPFTLFKDYTTKQWVANPLIDPSLSNMVVFYTKKSINDFELKSQF